jgi:DNA-binding GntR family transcriptional regulator
MTPVLETLEQRRPPHRPTGTIVSRDLLEDQIYSYLCAQLGGHKIDVGTHLKAGDIAANLDVSRTSVRKAIIRLVSDGCVQLNGAGRPIVVSLPKKRRQAVEPVFAYANQTEQAYWAVFDAIFEGKLRPGENVNGQELAESIGVSLGTVRQALDWLCRDGLLQRLPRRGWKVVQLDARDVVDAFKIRLLLEAEAIGRAKDHLTREQLERMVAENERVIREQNRMTEDERRRIDYKFHRTFLEASGSPILLHVVDPLVRKCMLTGISLGIPASHVSVTYGEHIDIARALLDNDLERAKAVLVNHLTRSMSLYEKLGADAAASAMVDGAVS